MDRSIDRDIKTEGKKNKFVAEKHKLKDKGEQQLGLFGSLPASGH